MSYKLRKLLALGFVLLGTLSSSVAAATSFCLAGYDLPLVCSVIMPDSFEEALESPAVVPVTPEPVLESPEAVKEYISNQGSLTVGVRADAPPFGILSGSDDSPLVGFDIDITDEFARRWSEDLDNPIKVIHVLVSANQRTDVLKNREVDLLAAAMGYTVERCNQVSCSDNYLVDNARLLVRFDSGIKSVCDLDGKVVSVLEGTTAEEYMQNELHRYRCEFKTAPPQIKLYINRADAIKAVQERVVDAYTTDEIILNQYANGELIVVGEDLAREDFRLAVPKGEKGWLRLVNETLQEMESDGTYDRLRRKWIGFSFAPDTRLHILQWEHFIPQYDEWFDKFAKEWGDAHDVQVSVEHVDLKSLAKRLEDSLIAREGATLVELLFPPTAFIKGLHNLDEVNQLAQKRFGQQVRTCQATSYLEGWGYYAYCHGYAPDPGNYRIDLWTEASYPDGPQTYTDLLEGGKIIREKQGIHVGLGMGGELDSEMAMRAVIWSFGGSIQDEGSNVVLNSAQTIAAVQYLDDLYQATMTSASFHGDPRWNNEGLIEGTLSFIINSLSPYREAQKSDAKIAENIGFLRPLSGPVGAYASSHTWQTYVVPKYVTEDELNAAQAFMLHLTEHYDEAVYNSELYNFPAFPTMAYQLNRQGGWLDIDPFDASPPDKLHILQSVEEWGVHIGYPGVANPAIGEVFNEHIITTMVARVARGEMTAEESVRLAHEDVEKIFNKWRCEGFVPGDCN